MDSETKIVVLKTIRVIKTTADSETPTVTADSEIKAAAIRATREARITVVSEIPEAAADQNLPVVDSETAQAAKAAVPTVPADSKAVAEALDKTIINNKTNS